MGQSILAIPSYEECLSQQQTARPTVLVHHVLAWSKCGPDLKRFCHMHATMWNIPVRTVESLHTSRPC